MRLFTLLRGILMAVFALSSGSALAAVNVAFGPNQTKSEGDGNVYVKLVRTGDLTVTTSVMYQEDWASSTMQPSELLFNPHTAPSSVSYNSSGRFATVTFHANVNSISIPYSISNDQEVESNEWVEFNIIGASSSSGTTSLGDKNVRVTILDNDVPPLSVGVYPGTITDEGQETRSFVVLSSPASNTVTLRVSTYYGTYHEANYPVQDDYQGIVGKLVTIPAGSDFAWVPVKTYQNPDPNDAPYENFGLCIDSGSVSGAVVNMTCAKLVIKDVPVPEPVIIAPTIFENAIGSGWSDTSWNVSLDVLASGYNSPYGIDAHYTHDNAGLSFSSEGFDTTGYDTLSFAVKGSTSNDGTFVYVVVYLANGSVHSQPLLNHVTGGTLVPNKWNVVHIPLSYLSARNTRVSRVVIESGIDGTLFFDELSFLKYTGDCE